MSRHNAVLAMQNTSERVAGRQQWDLRLLMYQWLCCVLADVMFVHKEQISVLQERQSGAINCHRRGDVAA